MTYIAELLLIAANIWMAWYHASLFKEGRKISHAFWGGAYLVFAALVSFICRSWWLFACSLFLRKVVFDTALNLYEGFSPFRVSIETTSIIDKIHYKLFGKNSEYYICIYLIVLVLLNIYAL